jgi:putative ABC transport system ATP-binding protein
VAIARSLINDPPVLLADEPTGNLDSKTSVEILRMFQHLNAERGITIILVTHDAGVASYAQRSIRMRDGLIESGVYGAESLEAHTATETPADHHLASEAAG